MKFRQIQHLNAATELSVDDWDVETTISPEALGEMVEAGWLSAQITRNGPNGGASRAVYRVVRWNDGGKEPWFNRGLHVVATDDATQHHILSTDLLGLIDPATYRYTWETTLEFHVANGSATYRIAGWDADQRVYRIVRVVSLIAMTVGGAGGEGSA